MREIVDLSYMSDLELVVMRAGLKKTLAAFPEDKEFLAAVDDELAKRARRIAAHGGTPRP